MKIFETAESAHAFVSTTTIQGECFELAIRDPFMFAGLSDVTGAGGALVLDAILAHGYVPDGFEQRQGFRLYRYRPMQ